MFKRRRRKACEKERKEKEKEDLEKEETRKRKNDLDSQISENNIKIKELKKSKELALGLIKEGSERLMKATASKNTVEIAVSQNLITQGTSQLEFRI